MTAPAQQQPPGQDSTTADVAALLLAGGASVLLAAAIYKLLTGRGHKVRREAVELALRLTERSTNHEPRMRGRSDIARSQQRQETFYRAAYVVNAAARISRVIAAASDSEDGSSLEDALRTAGRAERRYLDLHRIARSRRMEAAAEVAAASEDWGPLLGWHTTLDGHATPECRAADASNFRADEPPAIGYPGSLHGGRCRCFPGPPFATADTVDGNLRKAGLL